MGSPADASTGRGRSVATGIAFGRRTFLTLIAAGAATACTDHAGLSSGLLSGNSLYYGASTPPENLTAFEAEVGSRLSCHRTYFGADQIGDLHRQAVIDFAAGRMPVASIKPPGPWAQTAADQSWIESLVGPLGDLGRALFLCVHHEPENDAAAFGSPADYVSMQDSVIDAVAAMAPDVIVVPIMGTWSFDVRSDLEPSEWNVHGARVYGVDLYNPWSPTNGKEWIPFADKLDMASGEAGDRPMLVGEYGCRADPTQPGRAALWMADAFGAALDAGVVAMSYFNSSRNSPDGTWELAGETLSAFSQLLRSPQVAWLGT